MIQPKDKSEDLLLSITKNCVQVDLENLQNSICTIIIIFEIR